MRLVQEDELFLIRVINSAILINYLIVAIVEHLIAILLYIFCGQINTT